MNELNKLSKKEKQDFLQDNYYIGLIHFLKHPYHLVTIKGGNGPLSGKTKYYCEKCNLLWYRG